MQLNQKIEKINKNWKNFQKCDKKPTKQPKTEVSTNCDTWARKNEKKNFFWESWFQVFWF